MTDVLRKILSNGRTACIGPKPATRRHVVGLAAVMALSTLFSVLPGTSPAAAAEHGPSALSVPAKPSKNQSLLETWHGGWGMDRLEFARVAYQQGHSASTAGLAAWLLERLDGAFLLPTSAQEDPSVAAGLALRQTLAAELHASLSQPSAVIAFAQQLPQRMDAALVAHRQALGDRADGASFEATVGLTEDDLNALPGWLEWAQSSPEDGLTWEALGVLWDEDRHVLVLPNKGEEGLSWEQAQSRLQDAVDATGFAQVRISPALLDTPERADALAKRLMVIQNTLSERLGMTGPLLGLGGRVKLDLSQPPELGTHGQVVEATRGVVMRTTVYALPHEHYHALIGVMGQADDAKTVQLMSQTMLSLRTAVTPEHLEALTQESRERFEQYMKDKRLSAEACKQLRAAVDKDPEWDRLYKMLLVQEELDDQDARTALMMAMAVSTSYQAQHGSNPRWASLRRVVGIYLQSSEDLAVALNGRYVSSDEEILASAYAAQVPTELTKPNGMRLGILDTPGPQEAAIQHTAWRDFSALAQPLWQSAASPTVGSWRQQRQEVVAGASPRASKLGR